MKKAVLISWVLIVAVLGISIGAYRNYAFDSAADVENGIFEPARLGIKAMEGFVIQSLNLKENKGNFEKIENDEKFLEENDKPYPVEGGNIYYNPYTGIITGCDDSVTYAVIPDIIDGIKIIQIGDYAFSNCEKLTGITLPNEIIRIGNNAFEWCESLIDISIPDKVCHIGEGAFKYCKNLTGVLIPKGVKKIESDTFYGCENITTVVMPNTVTSIGGWAFAECHNLTGIIIPEETLSIGEYAFYKCEALTGILIPEKTDNISGGAFAGCGILKGIYVDEKNTKYTSVDGVMFSKDKLKILAYPNGKFGRDYKIPDGVTDIGDYAFSGAAGIESVAIPESVTCIGESAFSDCYSLKDAVVPRNVNSIGEFAFSDCYSLKSVNIPENVSGIGRGAFFWCTHLESINVDEKNEVYASVDGVLFNKNKTQLLDYPDGKTDEVYTIPYGVDSIGIEAFYECKNLTNVVISDGVKNIGEESFESCVGLTNIIIPKSVTNIGPHAFGFCENLKNVTILNNDVVMESSIFWECSDELMFYCYKDSSAEDYAKRFNIAYEFIKDTMS